MPWPRLQHYHPTSTTSRSIGPHLHRSNTNHADISNRIRELQESNEYEVYNKIYAIIVKNRTKTSSVANLFEDGDGKVKREDRDMKIEMILRYYNITRVLAQRLQIIVEATREGIRDLIAEEVSQVDRDYAIAIFVLAILVLISPFIVYLIRNAVGAVQILTTSLQRKAAELKFEKRKADNLVYQMLPKNVADNLRGNKSTSQMFDSVTICFSELVGFNDIARTCTALQLFDLLNLIYKTFDSRIDSYDVYKVGIDIGIFFKT